MAAGDRKVIITQIRIARANPVTYEALWELRTENKLAADVPSTLSGFQTGSFGTPAAWRAMTGTQMENQVVADVTAAANTPPRDSVA